MSIHTINPMFWSGKRVFLTGHTGFKGGWLSLWLKSMGAHVTGFALPPNTTPSLFDVLGIQGLIDTSIIGDIRDLGLLSEALVAARPEIVIHMAAQPLVRNSYENPVETYSTNVMGTVHLLEAVRKAKSVRATVIVTTDKCYENREWVWAYRENEPMGGFDPYSNSKGCAELVTAAYRQSFFSEASNGKNKNALASARAGNVIGGGDWSEDRLIPDAIKAFEVGAPLLIRNPLATRPWQHVLEPLSGYLILAQALFDKGSEYASGWNFGPQTEDNRPVRDVIELLIKNWSGVATWKQEPDKQPHEAQLLKLDISKAISYLQWAPRWNLDIAIKKVVEWHKAFLDNKDMREISLMQINYYLNSKQ